MKTGTIFKKFFSIFTLVLLAILSVSTNVSAADGDFDTSFSTDGLVTTDFGSGDSMGYSIAIQPDQKIIVAGEYNAYHLGYNNYFALARYTSDGSLDSTFGTDGKVTADFGGHDIGRSVAVQPDGKIVAAGYSETDGDFALVRYTSSGTLDDTFGSAGKVTTSYGNYEGCLSVAVQADGKIVAAGFSHNGSVQDFAVMRYNSDGSLDTSFDGDGIVTTPVGTGNDVGIGLLIQPDEKIVVTGISYNGTDNDFAVVRYNSDGSLDTSFGGDGTVTTPVGSGEDMGCFADVQSDGKIVLAGYSFNGSDDDFAVVRYNTDGSLDTGFGTGGKLTTPVGSGDDRSYGVCIQSDEKIVITGESYNGSDYDFAIVRYNSDGSLDTTFGNGGIVTADTENTDNSIHAAAVQSDGNIVTAGYSINTYAGWTKNFVVARYLSGNISPASPDELKLTPDDGYIRDRFGTSVSVSGDYAVVGAEYANNLYGSAYIFKRDGTGWDQQIKLIPTDTDIMNYGGFGKSVCISGDYAVVGSPNDDDNGSAYIFMKEGTSWIQQAKLTANDGSAGDLFGESVSISENYAVIGSPYDDDNGDKSGSVYIFMKEGATWTQQAKLTPGTDAWYQSGCTVSISGDYVIVGAIGDNENGYYSGSAYIFKRDGTSWTQQAKLMPSDDRIQSRFGYSVSMSGDYAIVGTSKPNNRPGAFAYIFKRDGTDWNEQTKLTADEDIADRSFFASSVSISGDYAVVGNYGDHNRGVESGLAYVFKRDGTDWNKKVKLASSDGAEYDRFGHSVSISGNYAIIGACEDDDNGSSSGSAYIYDLGPSDAEIHSPAPGATLNSTTATLRWNNSDASQYWLWVGTTGTGSKDLYSDDQGTDTSRTVYSLPNGGKTLYVRLLSLVNGEWLYNDYTYTAYTAAKAEMQTPAPGSLLTSTSETFVWSDAGAEQYWIWIGTSARTRDIYSGSQKTDTSAVISDLPSNGETLYVRLWSRVDGVWLYTNQTYTACYMTAEILTPAPGSVLTSTTETFTWNNSGAGRYWLSIGTSAGGYGVYSANQRTGTSAVISDLPDNGETLYVRLWSWVDGVWFHTNCTYTAVGH